MRIYFLFKQFLENCTNTECIKQVSTKPMNGYLSMSMFSYSIKIEIKLKDDQNHYMFGNLEAWHTSK